ncbi:polyphenol oxidase family protein [Treponema socranskii]|uniref:polyphenol oxidase family protein n=1 Tax=Treponema socranskii TaxID=53419 RepID=UPI003D916C8B
MTRITLSCEERYAVRPFYADGKPLMHDAPFWGMTLKKAGSMRFRWDETNGTRDTLFKEIASGGSAWRNGAPCDPVPLELIHSKIVYSVSSASDTYGLQGDGIVTDRTSLMPVVTAADCMPIFFYERERGVFGVAHSGWKGTGIVTEAIAVMRRIYGTDVKNLSVALGPHIRSCCYIIDEERASYFKKNFCDDCVREYESGYANAKRYRLSLEKANLSLLEASGVRDENIAVCDDCTGCDERFGSFRRETGGDVQKPFTVQAAFCGWIR